MFALSMSRCILIGAMFLALIAFGCAAKESGKRQATQPSATTPKPEARPAAPTTDMTQAVAEARKLGTATDQPVIKTTSGLQYIDVEPGQGAALKAGQTAVVHYTGWLRDGTEFDSSVRRGTPFSFPVGASQVIKGWDEGVVGMKPGGVRKLIILPQLGYGESGRGPIPPNAILIFEVKLLKAQ